MQKQETMLEFEPRPPESDFVTSTEALSTRLSGPCHRLSNNRFCLYNKHYFGVRAIEITPKKKSVKKSLEKSKIILEEKRKNGQKFA